MATTKRRIYVPHPLVSRDPSDKMKAIFLEDMKRDWYGLYEYFEEVGDRRWGASFLVRAIAEGIASADPEVSWILRELANRLGTRGPHAKIKLQFVQDETKE